MIETGARCVCSLYNQFMIKAANMDDDYGDDGDDNLWFSLSL